MSRVKVKVKKIKTPSGMGDEGLSEMFNQMLGTGSTDIKIAYNRYIRIKNLCKNALHVVTLVTNCPFMRTPHMSEYKHEFEKFCVASNDSINELFAHDLPVDELQLLSEEQKKQFLQDYEKAKKSPFVNTLVKICDNLFVYRENFTNVNDLKHNFICNMPGAEWRPFPFTNLNLKEVFVNPKFGAGTRDTFIAAIAKLFEVTMLLYEELQSPDIDVDKFVDIIMDNLGEIQKQPQLSRCSKAFQKIKDSVYMLKTNFNSYYRDFLGSQDSTIIMQHFILDVSKDTKVDPVVTAQFRTIINYYQKLAKEQSNNPQIKMLFDRVNQSFSELDKHATNINKKPDVPGENKPPENVV